MEARVGMTKVPDARLDALAKIFDPPKITYATVEYLDFPAISKEALRDPSYLASLRVVDALAHVLRVFRKRHGAARKRLGRSAARFRGRRDRADPERSGGGRKAHGARRQGSQEDQESGAGQGVRAAGAHARPSSRPNRPLRELEFSDEDEKRIRGFQFLSQKPMLCVLNIGEEDAAAAARSGRGVSQRRVCRAQEHRGHRDLRQDRSGTGRAVAGRSEGISGELRTEGIRRWSG